MAKIDLKSKKDADLQKEMNEASEELRKSRFNVAGTKGMKVNPKFLRRTIARIKTELGGRNKA